MTDNLKKIACNMIANHEGFYSKPYKCPANVMTIGFGHVIGKSKITSLSYQQAMKVLSDDVEVLYCELLGFFSSHGFSDKDVETGFTENQLCAILDFLFNFGMTKFKSYSLSSLLLVYLRMSLSHLCLKEITMLICDKLMEFVFANGKRLEGLHHRRCAECHLFKLDIL